VEARVKAIVVGAGIAGLAAGYRLQEAGFQVRVLEAEAIVGGRMSTVHRHGFVLDQGASLLSRRYREMRRLAAEVGVADQLEITHDEMGFYRDGKVHRVRAHSRLDMVRTGLISLRSKAEAAKLLIDARRMAKQLDTGDLSKAAGLDSETLREYADRRMNAEVRDFIIDPSIRSLYGGTLDEMSSVELAFLIQNFLGARLMNSRRGIGFLAEALAQRLDVQLNAAVTGIERGRGGVTVAWERAGEPSRVEPADVCVVAVTAHTMARIYPQLEPAQREIITGLQYSTLWSISLAVDTVPAETAVFVQVPTSEHPDMTTVVYEHNKAPGRAPKGKGLINSLWLTEWYEKNSHLTDEEVVTEAIKGIDLLLPGVGDHLLFHHINRWKPALLMGRPGTWTALARFHSLTPEDTRVRFAGDYLGGSTTNSALVSGERAAKLLASRFGGAR
jgi:oxygen-dependent protoporphyrinogen oxidase